VDIGPKLNVEKSKHTLRQREENAEKISSHKDR